MRSVFNASVHEISSGRVFSASVCKKFIEKVLMQVYIKIPMRSVFDISVCKFSIEKCLKCKCALNFKLEVSSTQVYATLPVRRFSVHVCVKFPIISVSM